MTVPTCDPGRSAEVTSLVTIARWSSTSFILGRCTSAVPRGQRVYLHPDAPNAACTNSSSFLPLSAAVARARLFREIYCVPHNPEVVDLAFTSGRQSVYPGFAGNQPWRARRPPSHRSGNITPAVPAPARRSCRYVYELCD